MTVTCTASNPSFKDYLVIKTTSLGRPHNCSQTVFLMRLFQLDKKWDYRPPHYEDHFFSHPLVKLWRFCSIFRIVWRRHSHVVKGHLQGTNSSHSYKQLSCVPKWVSGDFCSLSDLHLHMHHMVSPQQPRKPTKLDIKIVCFVGTLWH